MALGFTPQESPRNPAACLPNHPALPAHVSMGTDSEAVAFRLSAYLCGQVSWGICFSFFFFFPFLQFIYHQAMLWLRADCFGSLCFRHMEEFIPALLGRLGQSCAMGHVHEARALPGLRFSTFTK